MEIFVLVKTVPDSEARMELASGGAGLSVEEKYELNFFDAIAVEQAVRIRESIQETRVTALSYGPLRAQEGLRKAVAMGADRAIHVECQDSPWWDPLETARVLAAVLGREPYDLILCGRKATDDQACQVGPMVAELLGIPHVGSAVVLQIFDGGLEAVRDLGSLQERVRCRLPLLVSVQKGLVEPRVPSIQGVMKGMRLQPTKLTPADLGVDPWAPRGSWKLVGFKEAPKRPPVRMIEGPDALSRARELARILREEIRVA